MTREAVFWIVWNQSGGTPTVKHYDENFAVKEAKRLTEIHGGTFYVFECTHGFRKSAIEEIEMYDDPCPF